MKKELKAAVEAYEDITKRKICLNDSSDATFFLQTVAELTARMNKMFLDSMQTELELREHMDFLQTQIININQVIIRQRDALQEIIDDNYDAADYCTELGPNLAMRTLVTAEQAVKGTEQAYLPGVDWSKL